MTKPKKTTTSPETLSKIHRVNLDLMKKVAYNKNFKSDIKKIRSFFDINENGFQDNKENEEWHKALVTQADDTMNNNQKYRDELEQIRLKKQKGEYKRLSDYEHDLQMINNTYIRLNYFEQRINEVLVNNKLPMHFKDNVKNYIFFNKITAPCTNHAITNNFNTGLVSVSIYNKPTRDEWKVIKETVEGHLKNAKNKKFKFTSNQHYPLGNTMMRPSKTFDRDMEIMEFSKHKGSPVKDVESSYHLQDQDLASQCFPECESKTSVDKKVKVLRKARSKMKKISKSS
jgi:hypothetical protein